MLTISLFRILEDLSTLTTVHQGYAAFWLAIRNSGSIAAKNVKIHIEYATPIEIETFLFSPVIQVSDWLGDERFTFKKVNNADFVFIAGDEWVLHAHDTDMFCFTMSTAVAKQVKPSKIMETPSVGKYKFVCTVWADGLENPIAADLFVQVAGAQKIEKRIKLPSQQN